MIGALLFVFLFFSITMENKPSDLHVAIPVKDVQTFLHLSGPSMILYNVHLKFPIDLALAG